MTQKQPVQICRPDLPPRPANPACAHLLDVAQAMEPAAPKRDYPHLQLECLAQHS
jgi:hypothetical protein